MHLPNELVVAVIESLGPHDLKSARLVCKTWCSYASGFLFTKLYVAPNRADLEVFNAITQHPILSECVRQLVYDGAEFIPDLSKRSYIRRLWPQTWLMIEDLTNGPYSPDPQINDWASDVFREGRSMPEAVVKWKDQSFINAGYKEYQDHSIFQQRALQSGDFVESLVQGLSRLVRLESVALEGSWPYAVQTSLWEHHHCTPLARRWNPFYLYPHRWSWEPEGNDWEEPPDGMRHYWIITAALVRTQRHIEEFAICRDLRLGLTPQVFERNDPLRPSALGLDIAAFAGLKRLHLPLATCKGSAPDYCDNIEGLPNLLGSMHSLQLLDLELSWSSGIPTSWFRYDDVFPQVMKWDNLQSMILNNLSSSATNLLRLLLIQIPNLKHLELGATELLDGDWESVIECLKQYHQFTTFRIAVETWLLHHDKHLLACEYDDITEYLMHGGRHPCLSDDQPAHASEAFMLKIDTSLRDRLLKTKGSRTHVAKPPPLS